MLYFNKPLKLWVFSLFSCDNLVKCIDQHSEVLSTEVALSWIRTSLASGILYLGRLENVYEPEFFELIRTTGSVQAFPVAFINLDLPAFGPVLTSGSEDAAKKVVRRFTHGLENVSESIMLSALAVNIQYLKKEFYNTPLR